MKKYLFFLPLIVSFQVHANNDGTVKNVRSFLWKLIKPCYNADKYVDTNMRIWYQDFPNAHEFINQRNRFPEHDHNSRDRLAKDMILSRYNQKQLEVVMQVNGDSTTQEVNPNTIWNRLPSEKRILWTFLHRRPYTYIATLCKWGAEIGVIVYCAKAAQRFKKWFFKKKKKEKQKKKDKKTNSGIL